MAVPSQPDALDAQLGLAEGAETLLAAFLRSVSHDLKSPLLTLSLSAELLADVLPGDERGRVAREAIGHGIADMERMLDAVTGVSRARRRILTSGPSALGDVLQGHVVYSDDLEMSRVLLGVDGRSVGEALRALATGPVELRLEAVDGAVVLSAALPTDVADLDGSCVEALLGSLQQHAGTSVAGLAVAEVLLAREGGTLVCSGGRVRMRLPVVEGTTQ